MYFPPVFKIFKSQGLNFWKSSDINNFSIIDLITFCSKIWYLIIIRTTFEKTKSLDKDKIIYDLIKKVEYLTLRVQQLETFEEEIKILRQKNASLKVEIAELKAHINSTNLSSI